MEDVGPIEKVQTFAMKRFLSVPLHSSNKLLYGETGRYPLFVKTAVKCAKYWLKLTKLPVSRLSRQTYEMLLAEVNGPQNKIGHPAGCRFPCLVPAEYK